MCVEMPYLDSYDESVTLLFNTLKEGELYSRTAFLKRIQPNRTLQMKWEVFRDRLRPGQEEEWRLVVTTPEGLPLELYCFCSFVDWQPFERFQSSVLDYALVMAKEFGLRVFQRPAGTDFKG